MKKFIVISASVILLFTVVTMSDIAKSRNTPPTVKARDVSTVYNEENEIYEVCEYNGKVAFFQEGSSDPFMILDVYVFTLPENDRIMINNGFFVPENELYRVVEDYTG